MPGDTEYPILGAFIVAVDSGLKLHAVDLGHRFKNKW
jgi:hypothetical protein